MSEVREKVEPWLNGRPYYCRVCGVGFAEYQACEEIGCQLEDEATALARLRKASEASHG